MLSVTAMSLRRQEMSLAARCPAGRFWPLQFIEAGIFVALTAAALGATICLLHRRASWTA